MRRVILFLCVLFAIAPGLVLAQDWPSRPVRIIVAYPTGGVSDIAARSLGEKLAVQFQQPVVIENRAGPGGSIGMDAVAKAAPDGYSRGFAAISQTVLNPHAPRRFESLPHVPTRAELGFEAANLTSTFGVIAPARVPEPVLARLNAEINKALAAPDLANACAQPITCPPAAMRNSSRTSFATSFS